MPKRWPQRQPRETPYKEVRLNTVINHTHCELTTLPAPVECADNTIAVHSTVLTARIARPTRAVLKPTGWRPLPRFSLTRSVLLPLATSKWS